MPEEACKLTEPGQAPAEQYRLRASRSKKQKKGDDESEDHSEADSKSSQKSVSVRATDSTPKSVSGNKLAATDGYKPKDAEEVPDTREGGASDAAGAREENSMHDDKHESDDDYDPQGADGDTLEVAKDGADRDKPEAAKGGSDGDKPRATI